MDTSQLLQAVSERTRNGMAENIRGKEEGQVQCPLCPRVYKSGKVCKDHLYEKHQGHRNVAEAVRSVANDKCPYCGQPKANLAQHKRTCRARPPPEAHSQRAPARAPAPATATSTRAQPGVNKGVIVSRSREEAIAQAALDLEFAREENELRAREQGRK